MGSDRPEMFTALPVVCDDSVRDVTPVVSGSSAAAYGSNESAVNVVATPADKSSAELFSSDEGSGWNEETEPGAVKEAVYSRSSPGAGAQSPGARRRGSRRPGGRREREEGWGGVFFLFVISFLCVFCFFMCFVMQGRGLCVRMVRVCTSTRGESNRREAWHDGFEEKMGAATGRVAKKKKNKRAPFVFLLFPSLATHKRGRARRARLR